MATVISGTTGIDKVQDSVVAGHVIQVANYTTGAMATGTGIIPWDNTIPQITEGTQFMSLDFTPKKANSKLKIDVVFNGSNTATSTSGFVIALFKNSTTNAIGSVGTSLVNSSLIVFAFTKYIDAVDTLVQTFSVRAGSGGAGTTTFNGQSSSQYFGGSIASSITITEIAQ